MGESMPFYFIKTLGLFLILTTPVFSAELENQLKKLPFYDKMTQTTDSNEDAKKAGQALKQLWDQRNAPVDPNKEARLNYQANVDAKPCSHCPKYLNLTLEVNKIVEKAKEDKDPAVENDAFIQLSKLKFMYYVVRSEAEQGETKCQQINPVLDLNPQKMDGQFKVIKDVIVRLPEMTDFQYYPNGKDEVYYYYRGEGANANIIIEVVMNKDGTAKLRYYEFEANDGSTEYMKRLQREKKIAGESKKEDQPKVNHFSPTFEVKTGDTMIPQDITLLKAGAKTQLAQDLNILLCHEASVNEQSANIVFERDNGQKWFIVQGRNITDGGKSVTTAIPVELSLHEDSKLKMNGRFENLTSVEKMEDISKGNFTNTQKAVVGLSDERHQYLNAETNFDAQGFVSTSASNNFKLTESTSVGSAVTYDREGRTSYSVNASTSLLGKDKLTTSFGTTSDNNRFASAQYERKFSETGSFVFGTRIDQNGKSANAGVKFAF